MTHQNRLDSETTFRPFVWLTAAFCLCLMIGLTGFVFVRIMSAPEPEVLAKTAMAESTKHFEAERYSDVIDLLKDHVPVLSDMESTEGLRMFADSCLKVPLPRNRHLGMATEVYRRIFGLNQQDKEAVVRLAEIYAASGEVKDAILFTKHAVELNPVNIEWRLKLAELLMEQEDFDQAMTTIGKALQINPVNRKAIESMISAMVAGSTSDEEIMQFIDDYSSKQNEVGLQDEMRLMHARAVGNDEVLQILIDRIAEYRSSGKDHAQWMAEATSKGDVLLSTKLIEESSQTDDDPKEMLYRHLQQNGFERVRQQLADLKPYTDPELIVIEFFAAWLSGDSELQSIAERLTGIETQFARIWQPVLLQLAVDDSANKLLRETQAALKVFPGSPWLYLIQSRAYSVHGEFDLAIQSLRIATKANPQWAQSRIELASLLLSRGDFVNAFGEAVAAIRTSPESSVGYELAIVSALEILNDQKTLSTPAQDALITTLGIIQDTATDESSRQLLLAVTARLSKDQQAANQIVDSLLASDDVSSRQLNILALLTTNRRTQAQIEERMTRASGISTKQLLQQTFAVGSESGPEAARKFLTEFRNNGQPLPDLTVRLAFAELLGKIDPQQALKEWSSIAETYRNNARIIAGILGNPVLKPDHDLRRRLIAWLQQATSEDSLQWQWHEIRLLLDEDDSEQSAASIALRINNLLKQSPESSEGYELMVIAMERLKQPDKVVNALETAIKNGVERDIFRLRLAELLLARGLADRASEHAKIAGISNSPLIKQRAANILLANNEYQSAVEILTPLVPENISDSDDDFLLLSAFAVASANLGRAGNVVPQITKLAEENERWFRLVVEVCVLAKTPLSTATTLLEKAEQWAATDAGKLRRLAGAWKKLAARSQQPQHWLSARRVLEKIALTEFTDQDKLVLCSICHRSGQESQAVKIYETLVATATGNEIRAIALNNLALHECRQGEFAAAEDKAKEAIQISPRPEFVDSLVTIYVDQLKIEKAISLLKESQSQWPSSTKLRDRLTKLQLSNSSISRE